MDLKLESPQLILQEEFNQRKRLNSKYSLRMLARKLDLPPGRVSEILSGKRMMTKRIAEKIASRLNYDPKRRLQLMNSLQFERGHEEPEAMKDSHFKALDSDSFYVLADWYHFAILSLMELEDFESSEAWVAKRLGISTLEVRSAMKRLDRLNLISVDEDGIWIKEQESVSTTHDLESVALRKSHKQSLEQAIDAIDDVAVELRDITSMTMAIDMDRLPKAKKLIKKFRRQLCSFLEGTENKTEVYNLNIQLVPATKLKGQEKKK